MRDHVASAWRVGLAAAALSAASLCAFPLMAADAPAVSDDPMQPIAKDGKPVTACRTCKPGVTADGTNPQRVAERAAPEYPAARRQGAPPPPPQDDVLGGARDSSTVDPLESNGSVLSLPGASIGLPVLIQ